MSGDNTILKITDGTIANTANLFATVSGAFLDDWLPKSPLTENAIYASNPYLDGKHLITKTLGNIIDTFFIKISTASQNNTIGELNKFLRLLEKAILYWKDEHNTHKFWLEARSSCETNTRYAIVIDFNLPEINYPFAPPFSATPSVIDEIQLTIEHTIWTDSLVVGEDCLKATDSGSTYPVWHDLQNSIAAGAKNDVYTDDIAGGHIFENDELIVGQNAGDIYDMGLRFTNVVIPVDANVINAYIEFVVYTANAGNADADIFVEDNFNPAVFTTYANFIARARSVEFAEWVDIPTEVNPGDIQYTVDFGAVIKAHITTAKGWVSGNPIVVFIEDHGSTALREYASENNIVYAPPKLRIQWVDTTHTVHTGEYVATCEKTVFAAPLELHVNYDGATIADPAQAQQLTHVFNWDNDITTFSANLMAVHGGNWNLLPAVPAVNDALYFGISGDVPLYLTPTIPANINMSYFNNLILDLTSVGVNVTGVALEYYDSGAGWTAVPNAHNRGTIFNNTGKNHLVWGLMKTWGPCFVNDIWGIWMRIRVTAVGGGPTSPVQRANTVPYTVTMPWIKVDATEIGGNINAFIDHFIMTLTLYNNISNLFICSRKVSRDVGGPFRAYLPFDNGHYDSSAYTGYLHHWTEAGASAGTLLTTIQVLPNTYAGRFRAFLRIRPAAGTAVGEAAFWLRVTSLAGTYDTIAVYNTKSGSSEIIDLGLVALPMEALYETGVDSSSWNTFEVYGKCSGAIDVDLFDLILLPVDENVVELISPVISSGTGSWKLVTSNQKTGAYSFEMVNSSSGDETPDWTGDVFRQLKADILGAFELEPKEEYYLIYFAYQTGTYEDEDLFAYLFAPIEGKSQRYLLARGTE